MQLLLCSFLHSLVTSSTFNPNIFLSTLFTKIRRICLSLYVKYQSYNITYSVYFSNMHYLTYILRCIDVQEDLREMGIEGWRRKAQDRDQGRRIAQEAKAHVGL
jgi:hypothetical protein